MTTTSDFRRLDFLGFPKYQVSKAGVMKSWQLGTLRTMKPHGGLPYWTVHLSGERQKKQLIHIARLVLLAHGPKPIKGHTEVIYRDGNPNFYDISNLRWGTLKEAKEQTNTLRLKRRAALSTTTLSTK